MKRKYKRPITLLEIMIVVLLIGIIGSVLGYNMKGSLNEGKAFKSREGIKQVRDILLMEITKDNYANLDPLEIKEYVENHTEDLLKDSNLVNNPKKLILDGWGKKYNISYDLDSEDITVESEALRKYDEKKSKKDEG